jgi:hypothetical protein
MSWSRGLLAAILVAVWGCGQPELDTSSAAALVESLARLEESIEPDRREAFRDAIAYLKRRMVENPSMAGMVLKNIFSPGGNGASTT